MSNVINVYLLTLLVFTSLYSAAVPACECRGAVPLPVSVFHCLLLGDGFWVSAGLMDTKCKFLRLCVHASVCSVENIWEWS